MCELWLSLCPFKAAQWQWPPKALLVGLAHSTHALRPRPPSPRVPLTGHAALVLMLQHVAVQHREAVLALAHQLRAERALQAVVLAARIRREGTSV